MSHYKLITECVSFSFPKMSFRRFSFLCFGPINIDTEYFMNWNGAARQRRIFVVFARKEKEKKSFYCCFSFSHYTLPITSACTSVLCHLFVLVFVAIVLVLYPTSSCMYIPSLGYSFFLSYSVRFWVLSIIDIVIDRFRYMYVYSI